MKHHINSRSQAIAMLLKLRQEAFAEGNCEGWNILRRAASHLEAQR